MLSCGVLTYGSWVELGFINVQRGYSCALFKDKCTLRHYVFESFPCVSYLVCGLQANAAWTWLTWEIVHAIWAWTSSQTCCRVPHQKERSQIGLSPLPLPLSSRTSCQFLLNTQSGSCHAQVMPRIKRRPVLSQKVFIVPATDRSGASLDTKRSDIPVDAYVYMYNWCVYLVSSHTPSQADFL